MCARAFDIAINDLLHFVRIKRFADVIVGSKSKRFFGGLECAETCQHDDGQMRIDLTDLTKTFDSTDSGHPYVHDDGVGLLFFEKFDAGLDAVGGVHLIIWFQQHAQAFARPHFVINNQDLGEFGRGGHGASALREARGMPREGRRTKKNWRKFIKLSRANR